MLGVSIALEGARSASETLVAALADDDLSEQRLLPYEKRMKAGVAIWYEFILLYYKLMYLFRYFIQSDKHRHQALQLFQGEVYDRSEAPVLDEMRSLIQKIEETPGHILATASHRYADWLIALQIPATAQPRASGGRHFIGPRLNSMSAATVPFTLERKKRDWEGQRTPAVSSSSPA